MKIKSRVYFFENTERAGFWQQQKKKRNAGDINRAREREREGERALIFQLK